MTHGSGTNLFNASILSIDVYRARGFIERRHQFRRQPTTRLTVFDMWIVPWCGQGQSTLLSSALRKMKTMLLLVHKHPRRGSEPVLRFVQSTVTGAGM